MHRGRRTPHIGTCTAVAAVVLAMLAIPAAASGPPRWTVRATPAAHDFAIRSVSCRGTGCVAMASECSPGGCGGLLPGKSFSSANAGASWRLGTFPAGEGNPNAVSCGSPTFCVVTATKGPLGPSASSTILVTRNAGASWAVHVAAYSLGPAACASPTSCVALGTPKSGGSQTSVTLRTTTSGASWSAARFPANKGYVQSVACPGPTSCVAVGSNTVGTTAIVFLSTNLGASWRQISVTPAARPARSVSCTGLTCIALAANQVLVSKNGGESWALHGTPIGPTMQSAACLSAAACLLVGDSTTARPSPIAFLSKNGGATWAVQVLPHLTGVLTGISCPSTTSCVAGGDRIQYTGASPTAEFPLVMTY
jgi:photosystem II stability/assembly factor-like uncharacterized protein